MKKCLSFLIFSVMLMTFVTCGKEPEAPVINIKITEDEKEFLSEDSKVSVVFNGVYAYAGTLKKISVIVGKEENLSDGKSYEMQVKDIKFTGKVSGLESNTKYYYKFSVDYGVSTEYETDVNSFVTPDQSIPVVTTAVVTEITQTTAIAGGEVVEEGSGKVTERGLCWSEEAEPTIEGDHVAKGSGLGVFSAILTNLKPGTNYHIRAYATSSVGTSYGEELSFATLSENLPTVVTSSVTDVTATTAICGGEVTDEGSSSVTERGICWGVEPQPSVDNDHDNSGTGLGVFTVEMSGLTEGVTYYVRAYAKNKQGIAYGDDVMFVATTGLPSVTTKPVTEITTTSAKGHGKVLDQGNSPVTERGICWSLLANPTIDDEHGHSGEGTGDYSVEITGLTAGLSYHVRAYAKNTQGISYGNDIMFSTMAVKPTVVTGEVTNVTQNGALVGGEVTSDGGAEVTERGVCWGTSHNPITSGGHLAATTGGEGAFTCEIAGLTTNVKYYVRAYAINSVGVSYGDEVSFTTSQNNTSPSVTTGNVTDITQTSAKCSGNVTDDGGAAVTERGICWGVGANPSVSGNHQSSGSGTGSFTVAISSLSPGTTYHIRAYAINSQGTSYGADVTFITPANLPTLTTSDVINITTTSATGGGNVTSDGGSSVTERGVCWSTSQNPTISGSHASQGSGTGTFTVAITGLTANTKYYLRAYAINSAGTAYGNEISFTTSVAVAVPTVTTSEVVNIAQTTATGGGNVTSDGGASVTERGICWSTSHNPTISDSHANNGTGSGSYAVGMTDLTPNTKYYVRAYAKNSAGISYGDEVSFTTLVVVSLPTVTTSAVTNIASTTATGGGNVTSDGNATVTERGVCWGLGYNPTVSGDHQSSGSGTGLFTVTISSLLPGKSYHVRAYATNSQGTSYGDDVIFSTLADLPTVTTKEVTEITESSAKCGGTVTNNGGANITARGVCWNTSPNPTINDTYVISGSGSGGFTSIMTDLTANTTYYVRAYATNSVGTSYGEQRTFTTDDAAWLYYSNITSGYDTWGLVTGGIFGWGIKFMPEDLAPYQGTSISKVKVVLKTPAEYTIRLFKGGTTAPTTVLCEVLYEKTTTNATNVEIPVGPISLTTTEPLWVSVTVTHEAGVHPAYSDPNGQNNPNTRYQIASGAGWMDFYQNNGGNDLVWLIQVYVTNTVKGDRGLEIPITTSPNSGEIIKQEFSKAHE